MTHYTIALTCPRCGSELHHVADGRILPWSTNALVECDGCNKKHPTRYVIAVRIAPVEMDR